MNTQELIDKGASISHEISKLINEFANFLLQDTNTDPYLILSLLTAILLTPLVSLGSCFPEKTRRLYYQCFLDVLQEELK